MCGSLELAIVGENSGGGGGGGVAVLMGGGGLGRWVAEEIENDDLGGTAVEEERELGRKTEGVEGETTRRGSPAAKSERASPVTRRERQ